MNERLLSGCQAVPVTATVVLSTLVAACGSIAYGFAVGYSSPAESGIMEDLELSIADYSVFGSILTFGGMIGALLSGRVADIVGRKMTMWLVETMFILGWILIACSKNACWLDIGRFSMGIGAGLHCYVAPAYIAEISPQHIRGGLTALVTFSVTCGFSLMFFTGNFVAWRLLALVGTIPCLVQVIGLFFIPESPRWLANIGQREGVELNLRRLRGKNADVSSELSQIIDHTGTFQKIPQSRFRDLFDRQYAHHIVAGLGLMVLVQFGGTDGVSSFAGSIFAAAGCPSGIASTVMAVIQLPAAMLSVLLMDKLGRCPLMMITACGSCFGCFLTGVGFLLKEYSPWKKLTSKLAFSGLVIYSASFSAGMGGTPWVIMSEIFPVNIKGPGGSLVTFGNWFSSWVVTYAFNFLFQWSPAGTFFVFATVCGLIVVFVAKLVPETKGRTLEEIQESLQLLK